MVATTDQLELAVALGLCDSVRDLLESGARDPEKVRRAAVAEIPADSSLRLEYLEIVDPNDMQPVARITRPVCIAGALWVGSTRLIDNVLSRPPA